jgi:hypothetical protein
LNRTALKKLLLPLILAAAVGLLWAFPRFWYSAQGEGEMRWLRENTEVAGWGFHSVPVDEAAERVLVADRTFNGVFTNNLGSTIHVFSAKRFVEKSNEIGLFIHTPDRCWVETGWKIDAESAPTFREMELHGIRIPIERRIFHAGTRRELVYFFGLQGGRPLPFRLDHYLATGLRTSDKEAIGRQRHVRASDMHFWARLWDSFKTRREFRGPKQFVRISTQLGAEEIGDADERLVQFLSRWLSPSDYDRERAEWQLAASKTAAQ